MHDVKQGWRGEYRDEFEKMLPSVPLLPFVADRKQDAVREENFRIDQVLDQGRDLFRRQVRKSGEASQPVSPAVHANATGLKRQGEKLLNKEVVGISRCHDGFDVTILPKFHQRGRVQKRVVRCRQEEAVP